MIVGVDDPPRSVAELREQLRGFEPILRGDATSARTVQFIRNPPLPLPARPPYAVLFAGAVATLPQEYRDILGVPRVPMKLARPAVSAMLGTMSAVLGRQSPSQRNARRRISTLNAA